MTRKQDAAKRFSDAPTKKLREVSADPSAVVISQAIAETVAKSRGTKLFHSLVEKMALESMKDMSTNYSKPVPPALVQRLLAQKLGVDLLRYYERVVKTGLYREIVNEKEIKRLVSSRVIVVRKTRKQAIAKQMKHAGNIAGEEKKKKRGSTLSDKYDHGFKTLDQISADQYAVVIKNADKDTDKASFGTRMFHEVVLKRVMKSLSSPKDEAQVEPVLEFLAEELGGVTPRYYERMNGTHSYREFDDEDAISVCIRKRVKSVREGVKRRNAKGPGKTGDKSGRGVLTDEDGGKAARKSVAVQAVCARDESVISDNEDINDVAEEPAALLHIVWAKRGSNK